MAAVIGATIQTPAIAAETSTPPQVRLILDPAPENLEKLHSALVRFAQSEGLAVVEASKRLPHFDGIPDFFNVGLQKGDFFSVIVTNAARERRIFVFMYERKPNRDSVGIEVRLEEALRKEWPQTVQYRGL
jgi:hypothetical protein